MIKKWQPVSFVPGPLPDFSPRLRDKIWEWPGDEASNLSKGVICCIPQMSFAPNIIRRELGPVNLNLVLPQSVHF